MHLLVRLNVFLFTCLQWLIFKRIIWYSKDIRITVSSVLAQRIIWRERKHLFEFPLAVTVFFKFIYFYIGYIFLNPQKLYFLKGYQFKIRKVQESASDHRHPLVPRSESNRCWHFLHPSRDTYAEEEIHMCAHVSSCTPWWHMARTLSHFAFLT